MPVKKQYFVVYLFIIIVCVVAVVDILFAFLNIDLFDGAAVAVFAYILLFALILFTYLQICSSVNIAYRENTLLIVCINKY